ncbi:MAG TPA: glycosyltransferase family 39 protein, partial [bacterium]
MDELTKKTKPRYGFNRIWLIIGALTLGLGGQTLMAQWTKPWTLGPGLFLLGVSIWIFLRETPVRWVEKEKPSIFPWGEWALVLFLLALAAFYRWYRLNEIPAGIFPDIASLACGSLRILHEGWRPFYEIYNLGVWEQPICYQLAGWFWLFGATRISLFSFSALVSMGALLLAYFLFRQLAGRRTALVALVFFGVMRWYLTYSRCAHPAFEVPFYLCGTVVSWLYALRTKKWWAWLASALFLGTGFHSYQALKILPLLVGVLAVYEWNSRAGGKKVLGKAYLYYFSLCVLFTAPVWSYMFAHASLGRREQSLWIGTRLQSEGWEGLLVHLKDFLLMFFRNGDPWPVYGWPGHAIFPLLDVVTGFFFILGFFQALRSWRDRSSFYGLCGLVVTSLTGILTVESKNA